LTFVVFFGIIDRSSQENLAAFFLPASALRSTLSRAKPVPLRVQVRTAAVDTDDSGNS
jgi:hypothetical protein